MMSLNDREPRVLIVEQNEYHGLLMERQIAGRLSGSEVVLTRSPDDAIRFARSTHFDVAVVDFVMADCDGLTLVNSLHHVSPDLAIIVVAEDLTETMTREIFRCGCNELLIKDSSYYAVIPRLVVGLVQRLRISAAQSSALERRRHRKAVNPDHQLLQRLQGELDSSIDSILSVAREIIEDKTISDNSLRQQVTSIHQSALHLRSSLKGLTVERSVTNKTLENNRLENNKRSNPGPKIPV